MAEAERIAEPGVSSTRVRGVTLHALKTARDPRGTLSAAEIAPEVPFEPARLFLVYDVPSAETRGEHAHRHCQQFLIAVSGSVSVLADDGQDREEFVLDGPGRALYLPAMTWGVQHGYTPGSVLLVLASDPYDAADYIRDYDEFLALAQAGGPDSR